MQIILMEEYRCHNFTRFMDPLHFPPLWDPHKAKILSLGVVIAKLKSN